MIRKHIGVIMYQTSGSKGQELVAQRMVRNFNKLGQKAYLITGRYHDDKEVIPAESFKKGKGYLYVEDSALKIPVIRVDSYIAKWPPRRIIFRDFIDTLSKIVDDFELNVLITHSTLWNGPEDAAKFITWRRDMRQLGGYQDTLVLCHMSHFQEPSPQRYSLTELTFRTAWNKLSLSKILETANRVLVVTPFEKASKIKLGVKSEKCFLFPGGIDDETFLRFAGEDTAEFLKRYNIPTNCRIISYLGSIEERKNPLTVLKVAEALKDRTDLHFIIAGRGDSSYSREVEKRAHSLPNVTYLGEIEEKEKTLLIKVSYLNIIMSRLEALGIVQLEFMYCGVPVITSGVGGQSWVIENGVEGVHVRGADDIKGAAKAVVHLAEDEGKYKRLSNNARERASKMTLSSLTMELDACLDEELAKESGLTAIPREVHRTLVKPEHALKTWSFGRSMLVATDKRIYIKHGIISRKVTELRYADIKSIEHVRRYPWKTPIVGAAISALIFAAPSLNSVFSRAFVSQVQETAQGLVPLIPAWLTDNISANSLPLLPLLISLLLFLVGAKSGFRLYGLGVKPIYLSGKFTEAIGFIREFQDSAEHLKNETNEGGGGPDIKPAVSS